MAWDFSSIQDAFTSTSASLIRAGGAHFAHKNLDTADYGEYEEGGRLSGNAEMHTQVPAGGTVGAAAGLQRTDAQNIEQALQSSAVKYAAFAAVALIVVIAVLK